MPEMPPMFKAICRFVFDVTIWLGALACVFTFLGVKPWWISRVQAPAMTPAPISPPPLSHGSVVWLVCGLLLFAVGIVSSGYSLYRRWKAASRSSKLVIHSASYAAFTGIGKDYDVTEFLRLIIAGDSLVLDIENHNFVIGDNNWVPKDPKPSTKKRLQVTYSYDGGQPTTIERPEGSRLVLPEDSLLGQELARIKRQYEDQIRRMEISHKSELYNAKEIREQYR